MQEDFDHPSEESTSTLIATPPVIHQENYTLVDFGIPYSSKSPISTDTPSTLIGAAATLLSLIPSLQLSAPPLDVPTLHASLVNEIKAFEYECQSAYYRQNTLFAARYILCVAIDDAIERSLWQDAWEPYRLLTSFHLENWTGEGFFQLLDNLSQHPKQHIELLELMYYCLNLGFEGKYRHIIDGHKRLDLIRGDLYQLIREIHQDFEMRLCDLPAPPHFETLSKNLAEENTTRSTVKYLGVASLVIMIFYAGSTYLLNAMSEPTLQHLLTIMV
jgi:type VI secretion system protein ImpK